MSQQAIPEYLDERLRVLRAERVRIDGRIAELEDLKARLNIPAPPPEPKKQGRRGNDS